MPVANQHIVDVESNSCVVPRKLESIKVQDDGTTGSDLSDNTTGCVKQHGGSSFCALACASKAAREGVPSTSAESSSRGGRTEKS